MKMLRPLILALTLMGTVACQEKPKTLGEKVEDKVNDGLDRRPGEKVRDAAEDVKDTVKDAVEK